MFKLESLALHEDSYIVKCQFFVPKVFKFEGYFSVPKEEIPDELPFGGLELFLFNYISCNLDSCFDDILEDFIEKHKDDFYVEFFPVYPPLSNHGELFEIDFDKFTDDEIMKILVERGKNILDKSEDS